MKFTVNYLILAMIILLLTSTAPRADEKKAGQRAGITSIVVTPDGKHVLSGSKDNLIRLWDVSSGSLVRVYRGHTGEVTSLALTPDGRYVLSGSADRMLKLWDISTGAEIRTFAGHTDPVTSVAVSPDGRYVLSGSNDTTVRLWNISTGMTITTFRNHTYKGQNCSIQSVGYSSDGRCLFSLSSSCATLKLWDISGKEIKTIEEHIYSAAFSPDSRYVLLAGYDSLYLRDIFSDRQARRFGNHRFPNSTIFSPDGRYVASAGENTIKLWEVVTGMELITFKGHSGEVKVAAFLPSAKKIVSGGFNDGTIRLWDISTGKEMAQFIGFTDGEWIVITPEGYYSSSLNGHKYLNIRMGNKVYGIDQFYDVFYRPDIVTAKLRGEDISGLITLTIDEAIKNPPPTVEFTASPKDTGESKVKACYQIKSTGGGIGEIRLFHNGKLIESDGYYKDMAKATSGKTQIIALNSKAIYEDMRSVTIKGKTEISPATTKSKGDVFDDCKEIDAVSGENEISVAAFNSNNTIQSYMRTINFNSKIKPEEPHLYILSIGIDQYKDKTVNLKYAVKDSKDIEEKLIKQSATLYKPENISYYVLTNSNATKTNILNKIRELSQKIKPADSFILFVAGHGILLQNQYYVLTSDYNGAIISNSMISSNEIVEMSRKIKSLSQLFIFDTCHAGGVDTIISGLYDARMSVLAKKMGLHIYASANSLQQALDGYQNNGLFTHTLLDGLNNKKEADKNKDNAVSLIELGEYTKTTTTEFSKKLGHQQTPLIINFGKDNTVYNLR